LSEAAFTWFTEGYTREPAQVVKDFSTICAAFLAGAAGGSYAVELFGDRALRGDIVLLAVVGLRLVYRLSNVR
jgi:hypothetical protein